MPERELKLLGSFSLIVNGLPIAVPGKKKKALIAMLALSPERKISRERLTETLWSDRSSEQGSNSLRQTLAELRRLFKVIDPDLLSTPTRGVVQINIAEENVDCLRLRQISRSYSIADKAGGVDIYAGELLVDIRLNDPAFEDYFQIERVHYRGIYQELLRDVLAHNIEKNDYQQIRTVAEHLIQLDRGDEIAHRALMQAFHGLGDKAKAMRQFKLCEKSLESEFGASLSAETIAIYEQILADRKEPKYVQRNVSLGGKRLTVGLSLFEFLPQESLVEEVAHDFCATLASALTQFRWLSVHPTRATFTYSSQGMDAAEIGRRLNIAYVIDGRLILRDNQVRLSIELVDVQTGTSIWAERFASTDAVDSVLSTEILGAIVSRLDVRLRVNEINRVVGKNTENMDAFSCVLNAINEMHHMTHAAYDEAWRFLDHAEKLDPNYGDVYSWKAFWSIFFLGQGYDRDSTFHVESAGLYARRAIELNPEDAMALAICGHAESFVNHNFSMACHNFDRSLKLNPHSSFAWMLSSATYAYQGLPEEAFRRLDHSELLCPVEPHYELLYNMARAVASFVAADYRSLTHWAEKTIRENGSFSNGYKLLIAGLGHLNRTEEARKYVNRLLELEPEFTADQFVRGYPLARSADKARLLDDLVLAGSPFSLQPKSR